MRWIAGLLILLLGGCGVAVSDKPMFAAADTASAPRFEDGIWLMLDKSEPDDCPVDTTESVSKWPKCADWAVYRDGQWFERDGDTGIAAKRIPGSFLIAGGDIAIMQVAFEDEPADAPSYSFAAFDNKPAATAKLQSVKFWIVMCGTYRASGDGGADKQLKRYPGFDEKCRPASAQVIRDAAAASRPSGKRMLELRWARAILD